MSTSFTTLAPVLAAAVAALFSAPAAAIVVGAPPDTPAAHVDPNTTASPWAGVGSLTVVQPVTGSVQGTYTASAIDPYHVLTAAHVVAGRAPATLRFNLNFGADLSHQIAVSAVFVHPDYAGFKSSGITHDDIAVLRLSSPLPAGVPVYELQRTAPASGATATLVGYGATGDGVNGVTGAGSASVKRVGRNNLDAFFADDGGRLEVYAFDFDGPDASSNKIGPPSPGNLTLGNLVEVTVAGGDSGSPAFLQDPGGSWRIAGINTFVSPEAPLHEKFGGLGGGVLVDSYSAWIDSAIATPVPEPAVWLQLGAGCGLVGLLGLRRRRPAR